MLFWGEDLSRLEIAERLHLGDLAPKLLKAVNGGRDLVLCYRRLRILIGATKAAVCSAVSPSRSV